MNRQINIDGEVTDYIRFGSGNRIPVMLPGAGHGLYEEAKDFLDQMLNFCNKA